MRRFRWDFDRTKTSLRYIRGRRRAPGRLQEAHHRCGMLAREQPCPSSHCPRTDEALEMVVDADGAIEKESPRSSRRQPLNRTRPGPTDTDT